MAQFTNIESNLQVNLRGDNPQRLSPTARSTEDEVNDASDYTATIGPDLDDLVNNYTEEFREQYDDDDDEGEPADSRGYHQFSRNPVGIFKMPLVIIHNNDDPDWLNKTLGKPPGIYSPEGYVWGRNRKEVFYVELADNVVKGGSLSQIYALEKRAVTLYKVTDNDSEMLEAEGTCDDPEILKLCCGEPQPHFEMSYGGDPLMIDIGGPSRLEMHIPPSQLPRWLYVYDKDNVTHPSSRPDPENNVDWFSAGHPLLPLPPDVKPFKYRLVDPSGRNVRSDELPVDPEKDHATLILSKSRVIRSNGYEYEGQISLRGSCYPSMFRVVAKLNDPPSNIPLLENEATMYNLFPLTFSKEFTGVQLVRPSNIARRISKVVPSFYGYYTPVEDEEERDSTDGAEDGREGNTKKKLGLQSEGEVVRRSILLTEYCGPPVDPEKLTQYQKLDIVSLLDRFHNAGFIHNSLSPWDIVLQPGPPERFEPLCRTPIWARTPSRPCFRITNFEMTEWFGLKSERQYIEKRHSKPHINYITSAERRKLGDRIRMMLL